MIIVLLRFKEKKEGKREERAEAGSERSGISRRTVQVCLETTVAHQEQHSVRVSENSSRNYVTTSEPPSLQRLSLSLLRECLSRLASSCLSPSSLMPRPLAPALFPRLHARRQTGRWCWRAKSRGNTREALQELRQEESEKGKRKRQEITA